MKQGLDRGRWKSRMTCPTSRTIRPSSPGPGPRSGRKLAAFSEPLYLFLTATSLARHLSANKHLDPAGAPTRPAGASAPFSSIISRKLLCLAYKSEPSLPVVRCPRGSTRGRAVLIMGYHHNHRMIDQDHHCIWSKTLRRSP